MSLVINETTARQLELIFRGEPHALLLTGAEGIGLKTIAEYYARQTSKFVSTVLPTKDETVNLEKGTITVEAIRNLYVTTRLRDPKGRIIIIDYAERMGVPAQNAFLKLLEEPTPGTVFILLTHKPGLLLPTITSRTQRIDMRHVSIAQTNALLDELDVTDATRRTQLTFIAGGLPAELTRLVADEAVFTNRATVVRDARDYTGGTSYQKLLIAKKYKDDRATALVLVSDAMKMVRATLTRGQDEPHYLRLLQTLEVIHKRLTEQGNVRLQLSSLVMLQ